MTPAPATGSGGHAHPAPAGPDMMELSVPVAEDVKLYIRHWPGTVPRPFLLVHGMASNARVWDEVAAHLAAAGHPVYAVDLRGHGGSDAPDHGYDTTTATADLVTVGRAVGLTGAVVAGHSWGGNIALRLAAGHPALVAGVALIDGGWTNLTTTVRSWQECVAVAGTLRGPVTGTTAAGMRDYLRAAHPNWSPTAIEASMADMRMEPDGSFTPRLSQPQYMSIVRSLWEDPPTRDFPAVTVPVFLLPAVPAANPQWEQIVRGWVAAAEAALPRATTRWYLDGEHYLQAQHPQRLADDLLDLARVIGPPAPAGP